jgi:DNA-directed RNA polymerase specialized sigma24 family protein
LATETAARRKLGMPRLTYSDAALERVEELLDAEQRLYTNGTAALPRAEREAVVARVIEERDYDEIACDGSRASVSQASKRVLVRATLRPPPGRPQPRSASA